MISLRDRLAEAEAFLEREWEITGAKDVRAFLDREGKTDG